MHLKGGAAPSGFPNLPSLALVVLAGTLASTPVPPEASLASYLPPASCSPAQIPLFPQMLWETCTRPREQSRLHIFPPNYLGDLRVRSASFRFWGLSRCDFGLKGYRGSRYAEVTAAVHWAIISSWEVGSGLNGTVAENILSLHSDSDNICLLYLRTFSLLRCGWPVAKQKCRRTTPSPCTKPNERVRRVPF